MGIDHIGDSAYVVSTLAIKLTLQRRTEMEIKVELPKEVTVSSRERSVHIDTASLSADIIAKLAIHGLTQKVADAASGAKKVAEETKSDVGDTTVAMMQKAVDSLLAGEWSTRTAGEGVSVETRVARQITRQMVKAKFGGKSPEWAKFTGLSDEEQNAKLDAWFAANEAKLQPEVDAELARRKAAAKAKDKLTDAVSFEL